MSDDWKVGDLALCVDCHCGSPIHGFQRSAATEPGHAYLVAGIRLGPFTMCRAPMGLIFEGDPDGRGHCSARYRKIRPDKHEDCEPEFVTLLKRSKVTA
jgi:hypothetical protein